VEEVARVTSNNARKLLGLERPGLDVRSPVQPA